MSSFNRRYLTLESLTPVMSRFEVLLPVEAVSVFNELFSIALDTYVWQESETGISLEDNAEIMFDSLLSFREVLMIVGEIKMLACNAVPAGFLACDGSEYNAVDYPELYAALPSQYHTPDDKFIVPDLNHDRFPLGTLSNVDYGQQGGEAEHVLTVGELASHHHAYDPAVTTGIDFEAPGVPDPSAAALIPLITENTYDEGDNEPHNNMPPFERVGYFIRYSSLSSF
jgi:microcystin-dependent protein